GLGFVPEDRTTDGLVAPFTIANNLILDLWDKPPYAKGLALQIPAIHAHAKDSVRTFDIRTPSIHNLASSLSGGNQQKVVLARELSRPLKALLASQPTRGLDVGSIEFVHQSIIAARDEGTAVLLVSSELDEVYALADRIAVMYQGRIVDIVEPSISRDELGL